MRLLLLSALIVVASTMSSGQSDKDLTQWELFKIKYGKKYSTLDEENRRKSVFLNNAQSIQDHNDKHANGEVTFTKGVNHFTDLVDTEVAEMMMGFKMADNNSTGEVFTPDLTMELPETFDWRAKGAVTPVKYQGTCGSCWAFSTTGSIEGAWFLKTQKLVSLSEQDLLDCDTATLGCGGGNPRAAMQYVIDNKGLDTEQTYPYQGVREKCRYNPNGSTAQITGLGTVQNGNENDLQRALITHGPISVAISASKSFMAYHSGVFTDSTCDISDLNHAVLVVGYGTLNGQDYWLVKNSWSTSWGMGGYIMMARNKNNMCGIASYATFPKA